MSPSATRGIQSKHSSCGFASFCRKGKSQTTGALVLAAGLIRCGPMLVLLDSPVHLSRSIHLCDEAPQFLSVRGGKMADLAGETRLAQHTNLIHSHLGQQAATTYL